MPTIIDMVEQNNARLLAQNPTTDQLRDRLHEVTEELGGAYQTIDRLRDDCRRALGEAIAVVAALVFAAIVIAQSFS